MPSIALVHSVQHGECCGRTRVRAASATPCAWLPADAQMTPRLSSSALSCASLLKAPRTLKLNTWRTAPHAFVTAQLKECWGRLPPNDTYATASKAQVMLLWTISVSGHASLL